MKNLTIFFLLALNLPVFSQNSQLLIRTNRDSAVIEIDNKEISYLRKDSLQTVIVPSGKHTIIGKWHTETITSKTIRLKEGEIRELTFEFTLPEKPSYQEGKESMIYLYVDEPATFQNGNLSEFNKWVALNIKYPNEAVMKGITGKTYIQFVVNEQGYIENAKVLRSAGKILDEEAIRVIMASPQWTPPRQKGVCVKQLFTLPVYFNIGKDKIIHTKDN